MTSVTGSRLCLRPGLAGRGFTLVEIMVVMAIIVMLFTIAAVTLGSYLSRASEKATIATVLKLEQYLDEYKSLTGSYPPDGLDSRVKTKDGVEIMGSACLYYFLTNPVRVPEKVGGKTTIREVTLNAKFLENELGPEDPDYPGVREIVDGWRTPIHYDNTEDGYSPQGGAVHIPPLDDAEHPPDPREGGVEVDGKPAVSRKGAQSKAFDIWSHTGQGHSVDEKPTMPIASWNIQE